MKRLKTALVCIPLALLLPGQLSAATNDNDMLPQTRDVAAYIPARPAKLDRRVRQALDAKPPDYVPRTEHLAQDGKPLYTNRLILEDSPYLIQHAHNPVDWHAWGEAAFARARAENKPLLLSIGYSTCHWCHVMEKQSFEHGAVADFINRNFIAIKVDRERRPDIDRVYLNALIFVTGDGGWPISSFLTPDGKPFFSGNYYRPAQFLELLQQIARQWTEQQTMLLAEAERIAVGVGQINQSQTTAASISDLALDQAISNMLADYDTENGGFGGRPKFPNEPRLFLLLNQAMRDPDPAILKLLDHTLDAMSRGGIYDHVGGGFHRYSVDSYWHTPHFEKMLYNQAHLARIYLRGWYLTGNPLFRRVAVQTLDYALRDMTSEQGAFYSATDADSEGEEGKFFFWRPAEIRTSLSAEDAELVIKLFDIREEGYDGDLNILFLPLSLPEFAERQGTSLSELNKRLDPILQQLYRAREQRVHPLRDEKIITAWNGMMISTLAEAGMLLDEPRYTDAAVRAAKVIWQQQWRKPGQLWRINLDGRASIEARQEDYAYYAEGLLRLYDATADMSWLERAGQLADSMLQHYWDSQRGGFYMSSQREQVTAMGRYRDAADYDRMPSGNSMAVRVLHMLQERTGDRDYGKRATATLAAFAGVVNQSPDDFAYMLASASDARTGETGPLQYAALGGIRIQARQAGYDRVVVDLFIADGWHINSDQPLQDNLIPTRLTLDSTNRDWIIQDVNYPAGQTRVLGFQDEPMSLFEDDLQFRIIIDQRNQATRILPLSLQLQACNDRLCLPPQTISLQIAMQ
ncbi:MAG: DUF255 domain-containing protein [Gammaproteobacteria bacterium]|nr:DUF255 domain-containing protein [Gammaproteobacteria bacterium]